MPNVGDDIQTVSVFLRKLAQFVFFMKEEISVVPKQSEITIEDLSYEKIYFKSVNAVFEFPNSRKLIRTSYCL